MTGKIQFGEIEMAQLQSGRGTESAAIWRRDLPRSISVPGRIV
jgi:hypothetical protein